MLSFTGNFCVIEVSATRWKIAQAAEIRWWKRYLGKKNVHDYLTWKKNYWSDFLQQLEISPAPDSKVLDAGCGPAGIFLVLDHCEVDAIDPLLENYKSLPHFQPKANTHVTWFSQPLESFTHENCYAYTFCLNVINHVRDLEGAMQVLAKATKPGGTLIVSVDAHRHAWLKPIFKRIPGDVLHPHQLDLEEYQQVFDSLKLTTLKRTLFKKEFLFDYWVFELKRPLDD